MPQNHPISNRIKGTVVVVTSVLDLEYCEDDDLHNIYMYSLGNWDGSDWTLIVLFECSVLQSSI